MRSLVGRIGMMGLLPASEVEDQPPDRVGFRFVMLGPSGVGKSAQAALLAERLGTRTILFDRSAGNEGSGAAPDFPADESKAVPAGLPDWVNAEVDVRSGFCLLGFPRTLPEAKALDAFLRENDAPLTAALNFEPAPEWLVYRLSHRRVCVTCGMVYPWNCRPRIPEGGACVCCGGELIRRKEDSSEAARRRLRAYAQGSAPLIEYYDQAGLLITVEGEGSPEKVFQRMEFKLLNALPDLA